MTDDLPRGPFTVWQNNGYEGWHWHDYSTLAEAVSHQSFGSTTIIQKPVKIDIREVRADDDDPQPLAPDCLK